MRFSLEEITKVVDGQLINCTECPTITGVSIDSRTVKQGDLFVPLKGVNFNGHDFIADAIGAGATASFWSNQVTPLNLAIPLIIVDEPITAMQKLAHHYRQIVDPIVVGITGSNGKTTTKDILTAILAEQYRVHKTSGNLNNHIGVPLTILSMPTDTEVLVVEMGMNHVGEIALLTQIAAPDHVILTNVGESHIEFLGTEERIAEAKLEILQGLAEGSYAVLPGDQALVRKKITNYDLQNIIWVGRTKKNDNYIAKISENQQDELEFTDAKGEAYQIPLIGAHNAVNALMAIEAAKLLGVAVSRIKAGLTKVKLSAMRLELIEVDEDSLILNDAYNASPTSMRCSLELLASLHGYKYKIAVLGDMLELGAAAEKYHYEIGRLVAELKIDYLIVIGNFSEEVIVGALNNRMSVRKIRKAKSIEEIVDLLQKKKWSNRAVLIKGSRGNRLERVVELLLQK